MIAVAPAPAAPAPSRTSTLLPLVPCLLAAGIAVSVLVGWSLDIEVLKRVVPGFVAMNPVTAVGVLLSAVAVYFTVSSYSWGRWASTGCALIISAIGLLKLLELISGAALGVDTLLFTDRLHDDATGAPNRIAPNTALNLALLGCALLVAGGAARWTVICSQVLALATIASSGLALLGYLYGVRSLYGVGLYIPMAIHTAAVFVLLSIAFLSNSSRHGLLAVVTRSGLAGTMARRLLLAAIVVPVAIGWLRLTGQQIGLYSTELGVAIATIANVIVFATAVLWVARTLHQSDTKRSESEEALRRQRSLVELLRGIAEASNQTSFEQALQDTLAVVQQGTLAPFGVAFRLDVAGAAATWLPNAPLPDADLLTLGRAARSLTAPEAKSLATGTGVAHLGTLIPVHDGQQVVAALFIAGLPDRGTGSSDAAQYAHEQLSRTAERARILASLNDSVGRHEALFNSAYDGIITVNESGSIESINPAAQKMFGYSGREAGRRHFRRLLEGVWLPGTDQDTGALLGAAHEAVAIRKDGSRFPVEAAVSVMDLGTRKAFVAIVRDISERKKIERMQSEFVSTVSHELRTPLTSIGGSLGLIAGGAAGPVGDAAGRLIQIAHANSQRLVRLVNDILDIEKLQSGRMTFQFATVELGQLLDQVIAANRPFADAHGVRLGRAGDTYALVQGDGDRLVQALTNILSNAVKFSPPGGLVVASLTLRAGRARVSVSDQGPGIPEEFRSRMFQRFAQADSSERRKVGGSGLGLSIAREILDRHGGGISFDSEIGRGTTFHLDLPSLPAAAAAPLQPAHAWEGNRILVCVSSDDVSRSVCNVLSGSGYECTPAANMEAALAFAAGADLRAVVVDTAFAGGEISAAIRELQASLGRLVPVVLLSGSQRVGGSDVHGLAAAGWISSSPEIARLPAAIGALLSHIDSARPKILHVEDDPDVVEVVRQGLHRDYAMSHAPSLSVARRLLQQQDYHLVLLDLTLVDGRGTELLPALVDRNGRRIPTVVFTAEDGSPALGQRVEAVLTKSRENLLSLIEAVHSVVAPALDVPQNVEVEIEPPKSALRR